MKKYPALFIFTVVYFHLFSQPEIKDGNLLPNNHYKTGWLEINHKNKEIVTGANVIWDYDTLDIHSNLGFIATPEVYSLSGYSTFPGANFAFTTNWHNGQLFGQYFYNSTDSGLYQLGIFHDNVGSIKYTLPKLILPYPFNFNDSIASRYSTSGGGAPFHLEYVGYGKFILPGQTINDVVLIKEVQSGTQSYTLYNWYSTSTLFPLAIVSTLDSLMVLFPPQSKTSNTAILTPEDVNVYPNPVSENFLVALPENSTGGQVKIIDVNGLLVGQYNVGSSTTKINVRGIKPGVYFLTIELEEGWMYRQKILIE